MNTPRIASSVTSGPAERIRRSCPCTGPALRPLLLIGCILGAGVLDSPRAGTEWGAGSGAGGNLRAARPAPTAGTPAAEQASSRPAALSEPRKAPGPPPTPPDQPGSSEAGIGPESGEIVAVVTVEDGVLRNTAHGFAFPVPEGWALKEGAAADELALVDRACEECLLRVLVSPGNDASLEETIRGLKKQALESPGARIIDEQRTRVARQRAYTLVKEERLRAEGTKGSSPSSAGAAGATASEDRLFLSRYVTFNRASDKYYLLLRAPQERFSKDERDFEMLLERLRFLPSE